MTKSKRNNIPFIIDTFTDWTVADVAIQVLTFIQILRAVMKRVCKVGTSPAYNVFRTQKLDDIKPLQSAKLTASPTETTKFIYIWQGASIGHCVSA